jgi:histone-lysine N-methyltransferase ASH1L
MTKSRHRNLVAIPQVARTDTFADRFVGDAAAYWKKTPHFNDFQSKCVCKPEDGCAEDCQNRIMLYECDETNCNVGKAYCQNRAFQNLQLRTKKGGRYRVGVEVVKTTDRGYGVRSNRCFEPNQIIMEYTGEIITEEECERRMNEVYKNNEASRDRVLLYPHNFG